jgi:C-terminal processing protease CtpA/Prc
MHTQLIDSLVELVRTHYVFPEMAEQIIAHIQARQAAGIYDACPDEAAFCQALTEDMQVICRDQHLRLEWSADALPEKQAQGPPDPQLVEQFRQMIGFTNFGIETVQRLPGNVGYLDLRRFDSPRFAGDALVAAMAVVAHTAALIVDLRQHVGGDADMMPLVTSYFFGDEPVELNGLYQRATDRIQQYWTLPYVPGKRYPDKPVYLLLGRETFSAGEAFAYDLQQRKRATLIGQRTRGGAHPRDDFRLSPHIELYIPTARAVNPVSGGNWEGTGVAPDIEVPEEEAFDLAYKMALEQVIEGIGERPAWWQKELLQEAQKALAECSI